jgi:predicted dinucleotide-binding enzyme
MNISIFGGGTIGGTLGKLWAQSGHEIMFGVPDVRGPEAEALLDSIGSHAQVGTVAEAAAFGEVILLAVPWPDTQEVIEQTGDLTGKILIDSTNPMLPSSPDITPSGAEKIAQWATGARVVKAFNTTGAENLANVQYGSQNIDTFVCGDDAAAKSVVTELAEAIGSDVVDAGPLSNAGLLEALAKLWVQLAYTLGMGPDIAFKLLKRGIESPKV